MGLSKDLRAFLVDLELNSPVYEDAQGHGFKKGIKAAIEEISTFLDKREGLEFNKCPKCGLDVDLEACFCEKLGV
tara:strand:- start:762 stop:986 length:225 start_codon:yes stop_codon:yes gene_type:complete